MKDILEKIKKDWLFDNENVLIIKITHSNEISYQLINFDLFMEFYDNSFYIDEKFEFLESYNIFRKLYDLQKYYIISNDPAIDDSFKLETDIKTSNFNLKSFLENL